MSEMLQFAREVLSAEAAAIQQIQVDSHFTDAVSAIVRTVERDGHLVVCGLGKSGLVGMKLSATFASTGTPSHFLHPTEAMHGDMGRIRRKDCVLLLSFGGGTEEVVSLTEILRQDQVETIAVTRNAGTALGRLADVCLELGSLEEACPHNLAPTASTTATMALGDALALAVARQRNFGAEDFQRFHPGGGLGRQMMPISDAMRFRAGENLPLIPEAMTVSQAYDLASDVAKQTGLRRAGALVVVNAEGLLAGIFTDGDLRRCVTEGKTDVLNRPLSEMMTRNPRHLRVDSRVRDAAHIMRELRIDEIPVVDLDGRPVGLVDVQDLVALKVIEG